MKHFKRIASVLMCFAMVAMLGSNVYASEVTSDSLTDVTSDGANPGEVLVHKVTSLESFDEMITNDATFSAQYAFDGEPKLYSPVYNFSVDEEGWIFIRSYSSYEDYAKCYLYSNKSLITQLTYSYAAKANRDGSYSNLIAIYVRPGTYYMQIEKWNGYGSFGGKLTATSYVGFMPSSERIKVDEITYSKDKAVATVTLDVDETYFQGFDKSKIRLVSSDVPYNKLTDENTWKTSNTENCLKDYTFKVSQNGTYTVRVASDKDQYFCMAKFTISDLKDSKPTMPKITTCKQKTNKISGTAAASSKIVVKVNGKSYNGTVSSDGNWSITTKSKLVKGQKVTAYIKNSAGTKSQTRTATVK